MHSPPDQDRGDAARPRGSLLYQEQMAIPVRKADRALLRELLEEVDTPDDCPVCGHRDPELATRLSDRQHG